MSDVDWAAAARAMARGVSGSVKLCHGCDEYRPETQFLGATQIQTQEEGPYEVCDSCDQRAIDEMHEALT